jgi:hypothetical protein
MRYKFNPLVDADNEKLLAELCLWIEKNIDSNIGWKELSSISKLTHTELQFLFDKYKQTTPMTYIRKQKEDQQVAIGRPRGLRDAEAGTGGVLRPRLGFECDGHQSIVASMASSLVFNAASCTAV